MTLAGPPGGFLKVRRMCFVLCVTLGPVLPRQEGSEKHNWSRGFCFLPSRLVASSLILVQLCASSHSCNLGSPEFWGDSIFFTLPLKNKLMQKPPKQWLRGLEESLLAILSRL